MSRSRARKNRFKYKTLRRIGFFKVFVMNYPNSSGNIYPSLNFGTIKYSKKVIQELKHPQGSFFSISSHVDEGYNSAWDEKPHGPLLQKMIEGIIGIDKLTWAVVMIVFCRHPELAQQLRVYGSTVTEVKRSTLNDSSPAVISDVYHLFDTTNTKVAEVFKPIPFSVPHEEHIGEVIKRFTAKRIVTTRLDWTLPDDK